MRNQMMAALLFLVAILLLSACSASLEEEQTAARDAVRKAFENQPKEPNKKSGDIEFYLPFGFEVEQESPNNIILKNGSKTYILFYNPNEELDSKVVYESALKQAKYDFEDTFSTKEGSFIYQLIKNTDKKMNELTIGAGGIKITTRSKLKNLSEDSANMADIIHSLKLK